MIYKQEHFKYIYKVTKKYGVLYSRRLTNDGRVEEWP